jgi:hypothetical protein
MTRYNIEQKIFIIGRIVLRSVIFLDIRKRVRGWSLIVEAHFYWKALEIDKLIFLAQRFYIGVRSSLDEFLDMHE